MRTARSGRGRKRSSGSATVAVIEQMESRVLLAAVPDAPTAMLSPDSDSGISNTDGITTMRTPAFAVTTAAPYMRVYRNNVLVSGQYEPAGAYTSTSLSDGTYSFTFEAVDDVGNVSARSVAVSVTIDNLAPSKPAAPDLSTASDTGSSSSDNITRATDLAIAVSASPYYRLYRDGTLISALYASGTPIHDTDASEGVHTYTLSAVDAAGNVSAASSLSVTVDRTAPAAPVMPDLQDAYDLGMSNTDNITSTGGVRVTFVGGSSLVEVIDGVTHTWTGTTTLDDQLSLTEGVHMLLSRAVDTAGNVSADSPVLSITVDLTAPAPLDITPVLDPASDSGISNSDHITSAQVLQIRQDTTQGDLWAVVPLNASGTLGAVLGYGYAGQAVSAPVATEGLYRLVACAADVAGNLTRGSGGTLDVMVMHDGPVAPSAPALTPESDTGISSSDGVTSNPTPTLVLPQPADYAPYLSYDAYGGTASCIIERDPASGRALRIYTTTQDLLAGTTLKGLAQDRNSIYILSLASNGTYRVLTMDRLSGQLTSSVVLSGFNTIGYPTFYPSLARLGDALYTVISAQPNGDYAIARIDPLTGAVSLVGTLPYSQPWMLSAAPDRGTLILGNTQGIQELDPATAAIRGAYTIPGNGAWLYGGAYLGGGRVGISYTSYAVTPTIHAHAIFDMAAGVIIAETAGPGSASGFAGGDGIAVAPVQSWYRILVDGVQVGGDYLAPGDITLPTLSEGTHALALAAVDVAGNISVGPATAITIDTAAPAAPAALTLDPASDSGSSNADGFTTDSTPTLNIADAQALYSSTRAYLMSKPSATGSAATIYELDASGNVTRTVASFSLPDSGWGVCGLAEDGAQVYALSYRPWQAYWYQYTIHTIDAATGSILRSASIISSEWWIAGLAWANGKLYACANSYGSANTNILEVDPTSGQVLRTLATALPPMNGLGGALTGTGEHGTLLVANGSSIVEMDPASGTPLRSLGTPTAPRELGYHDGQILFSSINDSTGESTLTRLDYATGDLLSSSSLGAITWANGVAGDSIAQRQVFYRVYRNGVRISPDYATLSSLTDDLLLDGDYTYSATAVDRAGNESAGAVTVVHLDTTAPAAPVITLNGGAVQRSTVKQIDVAFGEAVNLSGDALQLLLRTGAVPPNTLVHVADPSGDKRVYRLTFSGTGAVGGSLADGIYDLIVSAAGVQDLAGNMMTGNLSQRFHRLFGDVDGNRVVNALDYAKLKATYGRAASDPLFSSAFDYEGNSVINALDLAQFRKRYGLLYSY